MPAPYDYSIGQVPSPAQSFLQGIQTVDALRKREEDMAAAEQAKQATAQRQAFMSDLMAKVGNGTVKPADYERLQLLDPANYKAWSESIARIGTAEKESAFSNFSGVYSALAMGNPEGVNVAREQLNTQLAAAKNSKPEIVPMIETAIKQLDDPAARQQLIVQAGATLNQLDPERFKKITDNVASQRAAPFVQQEVVANAGKAQSEAETARIKAKYAEQVQLDEVKKRAADLGLTNAQTNQVLVTTRKLNTEIQKAAVELEALKATGGRDPEKTFAQEEKIRKEWQGRSKLYSELQGTFNTLKASAESANGPGDIALITGFMKMLDPGSVVRETEFATARDTAGLFTQLQNRLEKAQNGQLLSPKQRAEYVTLSQKYLDSAQKKADQEKKDLGIVVKNYRLNPENVFGAEQRNVTVDY